MMRVILKCNTIFLSWPGVLKGIEIVMSGQILLFGLWRVLK